MELLLIRKSFGSLHSLAAARLRCTGREIKARGWDALSENLSSLYGGSSEPAIDNRCEKFSQYSEKRCIASLLVYSEDFRPALGHEHCMLELTDIPTVCVTQCGIDLHETNLSEFLDQCVPLASQRFYVLLGERLLQ